MRNEVVANSLSYILRRLAKTYGLKDRGKEKPCMYVEGQKEVLQTNLTTTKKRYRLGRVRMQIQFYLQLASLQADRKRCSSFATVTSL
jgi:hypothetical protein